jgi:hypothetical protein
MDLEETVGKSGLDASGSGQGPVAGCCKHDNESSASIRGGKFLDQLSDYQLLKKDSAPLHLKNKHLQPMFFPQCETPSFR